MASNYNSLGFNLMTTGENAGTWGDNTNLNLNYLRDMFGYTTVAMTGDQTLLIPDNTTTAPNGRCFIIELTGSTGAAHRVLDIAATAGSGSSPGGTAAILKPFLIMDKTTRSGSYTITFKVTGATGVVIPPNGSVFCYHNGTDIISSGMPSTKGSAGVLGAQPAYGLPSADGSAGQYLKTDGSGALTFDTLPAAGISTGVAIAMAIVFG